MNRQEHLEWCKQRAIKYIDRGDNVNAWASFVSDMHEHPGTSDHLALPMLTMMVIQKDLLNNGEELRRAIVGFN